MVFDHTKDLMAQDQINISQVMPNSPSSKIAEVALDTDHSSSDPTLLSSSVCSSQGIGAGVNDRDLMAKLSDTHREPTSATTNVEHTLCFRSIGRLGMARQVGAVSQERLQLLPDDCGAGETVTLRGPLNVLRLCHEPNSSALTPSSPDFDATTFAMLALQLTLGMPRQASDLHRETPDSHWSALALA